MSKFKKGQKPKNYKHYQEGDVIGELIYIKEVDPYTPPSGQWPMRKALFECQYCGKKFITMIQCARTSNTKSCGCQNHKIGTQNGFKHGLSTDPLYWKWAAIKRRCYNKNTFAYKWYGGKGVIMYDGWINNPKSFIDYCKTINGHDDPGLTIDRINPFGNYTPGNIRFVDWKTQANNRRSNYGK